MTATTYRAVQVSKPGRLEVPSAGTAVSPCRLKDDPLVEQLLRIARLADAGSAWRERFRTPAV